MRKQKFEQILAVCNNGCYEIKSRKSALFIRIYISFWAGSEAPNPAGSGSGFLPEHFCCQWKKMLSNTVGTTSSKSLNIKNCNFSQKLLWIFDPTVRIRTREANKKRVQRIRIHNIAPNKKKGKVCETVSVYKYSWIPNICTANCYVTVSSPLCGNIVQL